MYHPRYVTNVVEQDSHVRLIARFVLGVVSADAVGRLLSWSHPNLAIQTKKKS